VTEYRSVLERAGSNAPPSDLALERILRRRDRKRRNQRIAAGVVAISVFVGAVWIVTSAGSLDRTQRPANEPSTVTDAAEDVVRGFLAAYGEFDADAAMTYVADDADLRWLIFPPAPANERGLSLLLAFNEAVGYQQMIRSCQAVPFGSGTSVLCEFDFNAIGSEELGRAPFTGEFLFTVREGEIVRAAWRVTNPSWPQMFQRFAEWVSVTYPRDFNAMFTEPDNIPASIKRLRLDVRLTQESIRLWRLRTREYVQSVQQGTA
jgi:hypothetical protein